MGTKLSHYYCIKGDPNDVGLIQRTDFESEKSSLGKMYLNKKKVKTICEGGTVESKPRHYLRTEIRESMT